MSEASVPPPIGKAKSLGEMTLETVPLPTVMVAPGSKATLDVAPGAPQTEIESPLIDDPEPMERTPPWESNSTVGALMTMSLKVREPIEVIRMLKSDVIVPPDRAKSPEQENTAESSSETLRVPLQAVLETVETELATAC